MAILKGGQRIEMIRLGGRGPAFSPNSDYDNK